MMFPPTPEETFRAYQRFYKKGNFKKAYQCLESLLHQFPGDEELMVEIVNLSIFDWGNFEKARHWLQSLIKIRSMWQDYALLSRVEAESGNNNRAREYLNRAKGLLGKWPSAENKRMAKEIFSEIEERIRFNEWSSLAEKRIKDFTKPLAKPTAPSPDARVTDSSPIKPLPPAVLIPKEEPAPKPETKIPTFHIPVTFSTPGEEVLKGFLSSSSSSLKETRLLIDYAYLTLQSGFDELLCLSAIHEVEKYWY